MGDAIEWDVTAEMDQPIKAVTTVLRGVPRGKLSSGGAEPFDPQDDEVLFGYPFGGGDLFGGNTAWGMGTPLAVVQSGAQEFLALSSLDDRVRTKRFYFQPGERGYRVELVHEVEGFAAPGGYYVLDRTWKNGDRIEITLPMRLHIHAMPDDPTLQAVMYGPLVLVGRLGTEGLTPDVLRAEPTQPRTVPEYKSGPVAAPALVARGTDPVDWIARTSTPALEFRTTGQTQDVTLVPFHSPFDERYAVYWKVTEA